MSIAKNGVLVSAEWQRASPTVPNPEWEERNPRTPVNRPFPVGGSLRHALCAAGIPPYGAAVSPKEGR